MMSTEIPESMRAELGQWNNGRGIDLEDWVGCTGNFALAVGYSKIFCPRFAAFKQYVFREMSFSEEQLAGFETSSSSRAEVEWAINHLHIADIQYGDCPDATADKLIYLGNCLKDIYEAKLAFQFPDRKFNVRFDVPEDEADIYGYQISFWQSDAS